MIFTRAVLTCVSGLVFYVTGTKAVDYCSIDESHTMCKFKEGKPGPDCGTDTKLIKITDDGKALILNKHNTIRSKVARGMHKINHCPEGADLRIMQWDVELALIAERWALQCKFKHDKYRKVARFSVGQNIYKSTSVTLRGEKEALGIATEIWYKEVVLMTEDAFKKGQFSGLKVGHFTQQIWNRSRYLGCGINAWMSEGVWTIYVVCNYGPAGNIRGKPMYSEGEPCSQCPSGTNCSRTFTGLCTEVKSDIIGSGSIRKSIPLQVFLTELILIATWFYFFKLS